MCLKLKSSCVVVEKGGMSQVVRLPVRLILGYGQWGGLSNLNCESHHTTVLQGDLEAEV